MVSSTSGVGGAGAKKKIPKAQQDCKKLLQELFTATKRGTKLRILDQLARVSDLEFAAEDISQARTLLTILFCSAEKGIRPKAQVLLGKIVQDGELRNALTAKSGLFGRKVLPELLEKIANKKHVPVSGNIAEAREIIGALMKGEHKEVAEKALNALPEDPAKAKAEAAKQKAAEAAQQKAEAEAKAKAEADEAKKKAEADEEDDEPEIDVDTAVAGLEGVFPLHVFEELSEVEINLTQVVAAWSKVERMAETYRSKAEKAVVALATLMGWEVVDQSRQEIVDQVQEIRQQVKVLFTGFSSIIELAQHLDDVAKGRSSGLSLKQLPEVVIDQPAIFGFNQGLLAELSAALLRDSRKLQAVEIELLDAVPEANALQERIDQATQSLTDIAATQGVTLSTSGETLSELSRVSTAVKGEQEQIKDLLARIITLLKGSDREIEITELINLANEDNPVNHQQILDSLTGFVRAVRVMEDELKGNLAGARRIRSNIDEYLEWAKTADRDMHRGAAFHGGDALLSQQKHVEALEKQLERVADLAGMTENLSNLLDFKINDPRTDNEVELLKEREEIDDVPKLIKKELDTFEASLTQSFGKIALAIRDWDQLYPQVETLLTRLDQVGLALGAFDSSHPLMTNELGELQILVNRRTEAIRGLAQSLASKALTISNVIKGIDNEPEVVS